MAQTTNLNVSPYFDDFNENDNYYKVLFKPGVPVQARELTGLQSILQNQIAKFGQHFFKEGSKVIPGNTTYIDNYKCVVINKEYLGITVESYIDQLLEQKIFLAIMTMISTFISTISSLHIIDLGVIFKIYYSIDNYSYTTYSKPRLEGTKQQKLIKNGNEQANTIKKSNQRNNLQY